MSNSKMPVCMITGLGEGTGGFTARRFAKAGYRIAMLARTEERLTKFEKELPGSKGYICDVSDLKLLEDVWNMDPNVNTRTVDKHVQRLRNKLLRHADYIQTVRGVGYRFSELEL